MKNSLFSRFSEVTSRASKAIENDRYWQRLSYALLLAIGILMLLTFLNYGLTWDEEVQRIYGDSVLTWYSSFFKDRTALDFTNIYGGFFEVIAQLAAKVLPLG